MSADTVLPRRMNCVAPYISPSTLPMPPTTSDLIFSAQANHNFSKTLGELKRSTLSIRNRLESIRHDAFFAEKVSAAYGRPLVANERCGSWYIAPEHKGGSAYFKSTDGHTGVWKFSSRRLNLHLLQIVGDNDGCIIIDSTRRGKRMPDALSKTVPIWCAVLNRYLFPEQSWAHSLFTPTQVVSDSENAQIEALLPSFVVALAALKLPISDLRQHISRPVRPMWITPESHFEETSSIFLDYHPIICCTVSRRVVSGEISEAGYIQGAADDTENWAHGLTPNLFWANMETLFSIPEYELPGLIEILAKRHANYGPLDGHGLRCIKPTSCVFITPIVAIDAGKIEADTIVVGLLSEVTESISWIKSKTRLNIGLGHDKIGSRNLRKALPCIMDFLEETLFPASFDKSWPENKKKNMILACQSGTDFSIGVALAILCTFFDNEGELLDKPRDSGQMDKDFIRSRLSWISTSLPDANPSRATLQSVNSYLMVRPR